MSNAARNTITRLQNFTAALESGDVSGLRASKLVQQHRCECGSDLSDVKFPPGGVPVMNCSVCGAERVMFRRVANWELGIQTEGESE